MIEYRGSPAIRDEVMDAVQQDPYSAGAKIVAAYEIRILCPRGHFIANVVVTATDNNPGILIRPRRRDKQYFGGPIEDENHGFRFDLRDDQWRALPDGSGGYRDSDRVGPPRLRVRTECKRARCNYTGSFDYNSLAVELTKAVAAGHAEHRLTN